MNFFLLLICLCLSHVYATSKIHVASPGTSSTTLKAISVVGAEELRQAQGAEPDSNSARTSVEPILVEYSIELKKNALVFDDLERDGVQITSCSRDVESSQASIAMTGTNLDASDFQYGAVFVINVEDWENNCGPVLPMTGIDEEDDALFYGIRFARVRGDSVWMSMEIISGEDVIPSIDFMFKEKPASVTLPPSGVVYSDSAEYRRVCVYIVVDQLRVCTHCAALGPKQLSYNR